MFWSETKAPTSYPFQNWRAKFYEQKEKKTLCLTKLRSDQKHSSKSLWKSDRESATLGYQ